VRPVAAELPDLITSRLRLPSRGFRSSIIENGTRSRDLGKRQMRVGHERQAMAALGHPHR